jgi:ParB-like chromosome segregation protein Spo0J
MDRLVICRVDELRPHSGLVRHKLEPSIEKLSALSARGEAAFQDPLTITQNSFIIDGYVRWHLARIQGRATLVCLQREVTDEEALLYLIQHNRRSSGLNDFVRILLALELEVWFNAQARSNQQRGGKMKASSNLTEADRRDVREQIAMAAGVSMGNVTKVKQLQATADPAVLEALRRTEIRIHRAWLLSKLSPEKQCSRLQQLREERGVKKTIRHLVSRHRRRATSTILALKHLHSGLSALKADENLLELVGPLGSVLTQIDQILTREGCIKDAH